MTIGKGKRPASPKRDFMQVARTVVEEAIGEHMDGTPLEKRAKSKRSHGGKKGGPARARSLTADQRRQIAEKAARARWKSRADDELRLYDEFVRQSPKDYVGTH